jgi:GntR family transcriptional regulator
VAVSKDDPRPAYVQIADDLREAIQAGRFKPGERLPSGKELATSYGVALQTLQNALEVLKAEGIVVTYPPRGTFVRASGNESDDASSTEYREIMQHLELIRAQLAQLEERVARIESADEPPPSKPARKARRSGRTGEQGDHGAS